MGLTIHLGWEYFLGIIGALIGLAYYANGRFTKLETSVEWIKERLREFKEGSTDGTRFATRAITPNPLTELEFERLHKELKKLRDEVDALKRLVA